MWIENLITDLVLSVSYFNTTSPSFFPFTVVRGVILRVLSRHRCTPRHSVLHDFDVTHRVLVSNGRRGRRRRLESSNSPHLHLNSLLFLDPNESDLFSSES